MFSSWAIALHYPDIMNCADSEIIISHMPYIRNYGRSLWNPVFLVNAFFVNVFFHRTVRETCTSAKSARPENERVMTHT